MVTKLSSHARPGSKSLRATCDAGPRVALRIPEPPSPCRRLLTGDDDEDENLAENPVYKFCKVRRFTIRKSGRDQESEEDGRDVVKWGRRGKGQRYQI